MSISWNSLSKRYWKQVIMLLALSTTSTVLFILLTRNGIEKIYDSLRKGTDKVQIKYNFNWFGQKSLINFGNNWKGFLGFMAFLIILSCLLSTISLYYRNYFTNLIIGDYKKKIINKLFILREEAAEKTKKEAFDIICRQIKSFADYFVRISDRVWIFIVSLFILFYEIRLVSFNTLRWGLGYFILATLLGFLFDCWLRCKNLRLQKALEKQAYEENNLVNNRQLIIKKGLISHLTEEYLHSVQLVKNKSNKEVLVSTFYKTIFHHLAKFTKFFLLIILLLLVDDVNEFVILNMFARLSVSSTYLISGLRKYPYYSSARKKLSYLFNQPERDDYQKNIIISEQIETINLKNVGFSYENGTPVFNKLNLVFKKGEINHLQAHNGFGKTTVVNLLFGLYQPNQGEISVNDKYKLTEINLTKWRERIGYAEHQNLIEEPWSTGQKQLIDLQETFDREKEVFIFDEVDSNLDESNKKIFHQELEKFSRKKLVILLSAKG